MKRQIFQRLDVPMQNFDANLMAVVPNQLDEEISKNILKANRATEYPMLLNSANLMGVVPCQLKKNSARYKEQKKYLIAMRGV